MMSRMISSLCTRNSQVYRKYAYAVWDESIKKRNKEEKKSLSIDHEGGLYNISTNSSSYKFMNKSHLYLSSSCGSNLVSVPRGTR